MTLQEILKLAGLEEEVINTVNTKLDEEGITIHENIEDNDENKWIPKSRLDTVIEQRNEFETNNNELQKTIKKLQKSATTSDEDKQLIEQLQTQLDDSNGKIRELQVNSGIKDVALKYKAKDVDDILRFINKDKIEFDDDGNMTGVEEQIKNLSENKSYLFGSDTLEGRDPHLNKNDQSKKTKFTREQVESMSESEILKNWDAIQNSGLL